MFSRSLTSHAVTRFLKHVVKPLLLRPGTDITALRSQAVMLSERLARMPRNVRVCNGRLDGIPVRWLYSEKSSADFIILYLHGGGFVLPALKPHYAFCGMLALKTNATVIMPSYRLAPEHPFPAGVEDCLAAYRWLLEHDYDPAKIIIAGDSAGGNLTMTTVLGARREGLPLPAGMLMLSPALRFEESASGSHQTNRQLESMLSERALRFFKESYMPEGKTPEHDCMHPLEADFAGLPPMRFYVGSTEVLLDDSLLAAQKAREEGVDVEIMVAEGMPHVWPILDVLPESIPAREDIVKFINSLWQSIRPLYSVPRR